MAFEGMKTTLLVISVVSGCDLERLVNGLLFLVV
jgi:hypothetical protein